MDWDNCFKEGIVVRVRNEITYRGFLIGKDYYKRNNLEIRSIIRKLKGSLK